MNITNKSHIGKALLGVSLSLSIAFGGSIMVAPQSAHAAAGVSAADNIFSAGKQFLGVRYQFGAKAGRTDAFDCSSFVQYVFKQNGISLPRSSRQQASAGTYVSKSQLQPGDLVFSDTNRDGVINHVSIYMGDGKLLHTYRVGIWVTISDFAGSTWDRTFVTARRVISNNGQAAPAAVQPAVKQSQPAYKAPVRQPQPKYAASAKHQPQAYSALVKQKSHSSHTKYHEFEYQRDEH